MSVLSYASDEAQNRYRQVRAFCDPADIAPHCILPVGPDNDVPLVPLPVNTQTSLKTAQSGKGCFLSYPGLPFQKRMEHYVDDGAGNMVFDQYVEASVDLSQNFTFGRVVTSDTRIMTGFQLASGPSSTVSAAIQGFIGGTCVEGGISQLYEPGKTSSEVFSIANCSQLIGNPANKLFGNDASDGIAYFQPPNNSQFIRLSDPVPGIDDVGVNENLDWSLANIEAVRTNLDKAPNWDAGQIDISPTTLTKEFVLPAISTDLPFHAEVQSNLEMSMTVASVPIEVTLSIDAYGLDRTTVLDSWNLVRFTQNIGDETHIIVGSTKVIPDEDTVEIHPTWTALKPRLTVKALDAPVAPETFVITGEVALKVTEPLYCGRGNAQRPILYLYEGFAPESPINIRLFERFEVSPNTQLSKISCPNIRKVSAKTWKLLTKFQTEWQEIGESWFYGAGNAVCKNNLPLQSSKIQHVLKVLFLRYYPRYENSIVAHDMPDHPDFANAFTRFMNKASHKGLNYLKKGAKYAYNHGGRKLMVDLAGDIPEIGPGAKMIANKALPKKFAAGASFDAENPMTFNRFATTLNPEDFVTLTGFEVEDDSTPFIERGRKTTGDELWEQDSQRLQARCAPRPEFSTKTSKQIMDQRLKEVPKNIVVDTALPKDDYNEELDFYFEKEIEPTQLEAPRLFAPSISYENGGKFNSDMWCILPTSPNLLKWFNAIVAKVNPRNNWTSLGGHILIGHCGLKVSCPRIQTDLMVVHVRSLYPLIFDSAPCGTGVSIKFALREFPNLSGPLNAAFSGDVQGQDIVPLDPHVAWVKAQTCKNFGLPLFANANVDGIIQVTHTTQFKPLIPMKTHRFSSERERPMNKRFSQPRNSRQNTPQHIDYPNPTRGMSPQRATTQKKGKGRPNNQPKNSPRPPFTPNDPNANKVLAQIEFPEYEQYVINKLSSRMIPTGRWQLLANVNQEIVDERIVAIWNALPPETRVPDATKIGTAVILNLLLKEGSVVHQSFKIKAGRNNFEKTIDEVTRQIAKPAQLVVSAQTSA